MASADLEISLYQQGDGSFAADVSLFTEGEVRVALASRVLIDIDGTALLATSNDRRAYGRQLSAMLFANPSMRSAWDRAHAFALGANVFLRLLVRLDLRAPDLHAICWETLRDPRDNSTLALHAQTLLSRYLESDDLTPVRVGPRGDLRALAVAANPHDLERFGMGRIDAVGELGRAAASLAPLPVTMLGGPGAGPRASWPNLLDALQAGQDILYLACHGTLRAGESLLWLEDAAGASSRVAGADLAQAIAGLRRRPVLVVLAVCNSASGAQGDGALVSIGALLARAGVPAVIAMQGSAPMALVEQLMPVLFRRLLAHGQIDRALAEARLSLESGLPWWMPALMLRVADGALWRGEDHATETPAPPPSLTPAQQRRRERRHADLSAELELRSEKLAFLRRARAVEAGAAQQFQLDKQIADEQRAIEAIEAELDH